MVLPRTVPLKYAVVVRTHARPLSCACNLHVHVIVYLKKCTYKRVLSSSPPVQYNRPMLRLRIKEVATEKGYSMGRLSRASDVSFNTVKRLWTRPYTGANVDTLNKIAKVLGVTINDLVENVPDD